MSKQEEFDRLAGAFRLLVHYRRKNATDAKQRRFDEMSAQAYEEAISKHNLRGLRATFSDLCGTVEDAEWGEEYLREYEARYGVSLWDIRGSKGPRARLSAVFARGRIETPTEFRLAQDHLDAKLSAQERQRVERLIDEYCASQPKQP